MQRSMKIRGQGLAIFFSNLVPMKSVPVIIHMLVLSSSSSSSFDCCSGDQFYHTWSSLRPWLSFVALEGYPLFCTVHHLHALHRTLRHQRWSMYSRYKHLKNLTLQLSCTGKDILRIYEYHPLHLHGLPLQDHCDISESSVQVFRFISSRMLTK